MFVFRFGGDSCKKWKTSLTLICCSKVSGFCLLDWHVLVAKAMAFWQDGPPMATVHPAWLMRIYKTTTL
eukprot:1868280-Amphidinium_carterae.1